MKVSQTIRCICLNAVVVCGLAGLFSGSTVHGAPSPLIVGNGGYASPYFAADFIEDVTEYSSAIVNPALLYRINQMHLEIAAYRWGAESGIAGGALGYQKLSFLYPIGLRHTAGLTWIGTGASISSSVIDASNTGTNLPGSVSFGDMWFIGHYSFKLFPWFMLGTNIKMLVQQQFGSNSLGVGADLGAYFNPLDHYRYGDLGISINLQDIVPTSLKWKSTSSFQGLPTRGRVGVRYAGLNDKLVVGTDLVFEDIFAGIEGIVKSAYDTTGGKIRAPSLTDRARIGVYGKWQFIPDIWFKAGLANNAIPYLGFNYNFIYSLPEMTNFVNLDFNGGYSLLENSRGITMMTRLSTDFGYTREQIESKKMYDKLIVAPMDAYREAMQLYLAGKYWQAAFAFGKVISMFPNFHMNDKVAYYMGDSYKKVRLNTLARQTYKQAMEDYPTSDMRAKYLYGLECIDYREGKFEDAIKNHAYITNLYGESDIVPDADYVAGQIYFMRKNFNAAEQLFQKITKESPMFPYAQFTLSIINLDNKKQDAAIVNLNNVIADSTNEPTILLMKDAANLKKGILYYENVDLKNAVVALQKIPDGSSSGDEAAIVTAWSFVNANQPLIALKSTDKLLSLYPESPYVAEAYLVRAYCFMLQRKYTEAIDMFEKCIEDAKQGYITDRDVDAERQKFNSTVQEFQPTAEKIRKNALRKPTAKTLEERTDYETSFTQFAKQQRDFFDYVQKSNSQKKFLRNKDKMVQDAEYALATAKRLSKSGGEQKILNEQKKQQDAIDAEILRKMQELENTK